MLLARSGQLGVKTPGRPSHSGNPHICEFYQQQLTLALSDFFREKSLRASGRRWQKGIIWEHSRAAVPRLFGTRDQFCGRQVFQGLQGREVGRCITFIVHFISIITSAPPQIIRH